MNITTYGIEKESLDEMLREAANGNSQLPDFQRGVGLGRRPCSKFARQYLPWVPDRRCDDA